MQQILPKSIKKVEPHIIQKRLNQVEIHLANNCNLKCRGCDHFSCICDDTSIDNNVIVSDLKRLHEIFNGEINKILLLGGEPLLNVKAYEIIEFAANLFNKSEILIVTNGLLLPTQNELFFESCRKENVKIVITKYPINLDYKRIEKLLKEKNCNYEYFGNTNTKKKTSYKIPLDLSGRQNIQFNFHNCFYANYCVQLYYGKLFTCTTPAYIHFFNKKFNKHLIVTNDDYIDIYDKDITKEYILKKLATPIPFCKYCNVKKRIFEQNWSITTKNEKEWL